MIGVPPAEVLTHRSLCRAAARWMLEDRGLHSACYEVACAGGFADAVGVTTPDPAAEVTMRARDYTVVHAVMEAKRQRRSRRASADPAPLFAALPREADVKPHHLRAIERHRVSPVVAVAECKVSRSDLLADLRAGKLRRYETAASECWLVAPLLVLCGPGVRAPRLEVESLTDIGREAVGAGLDLDGLPPGWGVLARRDGRLYTVRAARQQAVEPWEVVGWTARIAASYSHRALLGANRGPMASEAEWAGPSLVPS